MDLFRFDKMLHLNSSLTRDPDADSIGLRLPNPSDCESVWVGRAGEMSFSFYPHLLLRRYNSANCAII